jgi:hypothetical protein
MTFVRVTGELSGRPVWATWQDGEIDGSPELLQRAYLLALTGSEVPLGGEGRSLPAKLDNAWSFTATLTSLVEDPDVSGDELPSVTAAKEDR